MHRCSKLVNRKQPAHMLLACRHLLSFHRPVQWTSSSLIITAHATEPSVICVHFPSNKHFTLPRAHSLAASSESYEPPSVISASTKDDWIFAYFPGVDRGGIGCLWNKSRLVDDWVVKECRTFAKGGAVVAARWLNPDREVSIDSPNFSLHCRGSNVVVFICNSGRAWIRDHSFAYQRSVLSFLC